MDVICGSIGSIGSRDGAGVRPNSSGKAMVASRMRLARTQDVLVIAELSDGRFLMSKRNVKVTIGGCGG